MTILLEMVHDARIIRLNSEHAPDVNRKWLGDSIGWWEGDTMVVETKNFKERTGLYGGDENLHLVGRFRKPDNGNLLYSFTVTDPTIWERPWSGEYIWKASEDKVYEYTSHEGNYAMGNIPRGARILDSEYTGPVAARRRSIGAAPALLLAGNVAQPYQLESRRLGAQWTRLCCAPVPAGLCCRVRHRRSTGRVRR